jgi:CBS domain-containing protein
LTATAAADACARLVPSARGTNDADDAVGLAAADVLHKSFTALPHSATIGDVRDWLAASSHRRVAFLADDGHYVGSLTPADLAGDLDAGRRASEVARRGLTIAPEAPASGAYELALSSDARRVAVIDRDGRLLGVVAVTADRAAFCGSA